MSTLDPRSARHRPAPGAGAAPAAHARVVPRLPVRGPPVRPGADDVDEQVVRRLSARTWRGRTATGSTDVDGNEYVDFALGDTGAMAGHSPAATVAAVTPRIAVDGGITTMMPSEDAEWVAAELTRPVRPAAVVLQPDGDRRQPVGAAHRADGDRTRRRSWRSRTATTGRSTRRSSSPAGWRHACRGAATSDPRCPSAQTTRVAEFNDLDTVERGPCARGRGRARHGAGADQHRHRAARAGFPGRCPGRCARGTATVAADRRDAHDLGRARRVHHRVGPAARTSS